MKLLTYSAVFLFINFGALAIGSWLMNNGPQTQWYQDLNQAPWTPPGWAFGVAWTSIMICFSIYMAYLYKASPNAKLIGLFIVQFLLNVSWNYIFFNRHFIILGLVCLLLLTLVVGKILWDYKTLLKYKSLLIMPYFIWLCVAASLNGYIVFNN
ncbi:TspO/MBR family protein [Aestuariivivens sediminis]|uniref:TspO/MBR family protein n=1 Tax=Aestuariivivens sediminis TaxID=2913557 RepID=UPI001F5972C3|nr:TspO/MBR family protein [Aestuariivivens sediminis]